MVKVEIPSLNGPLDGDEASDADGVGIMSGTDESDVDDEIGDPDWDEVKGENDDEDSPIKMPNLPAEGVTISIGRSRRSKRGKSRKGGGSDDDDAYMSGDDIVSKKRRKPMDLNEMVRRGINRVKITEQLMRHKFSLLLYLARGLRLVKIINCNIITGLSLSIVDSRFKIKAKKGERKLLEQFLEQFTDLIQISTDDDTRSKHMQQPFMLNMLECYANLETTSLIELVVMFVACFKAFRPKTTMRVINVLRPITLRADIIPKPAEEESKPIVVEIDGESKPTVIEIDEETKPSVIEIDVKSKSKIKKVDKHSKQQPKQQPEYSEIVEKLDFWVEIYLEDEKKWCCVDLCNVKLDEPNVLTELCRPFNYLVSYDIDRQCVKPAERNYCEHWYTPGFRRGRCEDRWWDSLMGALGPAKSNEKDHADVKKEEEVLTKVDMPNSDAAFRNHPLYVLEKHLLKFQGIYPPEVPPMGFFKDSPVYPRDCVQTLMSRETWLRQARTVKLNETPYKIVKARPKRDKYTGDLIRDLPLEVFGEWQTQPYDPPQAVDGKVPRNAYGNVDMYQPCMLPKGCEWLKLPGLTRVANKLGIDIAAAVVGFDNHCGSYGAHPVIDGFVVCEEFAATLKMAWEEEQVNIRKREDAKREKRIWDNWKRLVKAAIIREKLRVKYKNS